MFKAALSICDQAASEDCASYTVSKCTAVTPGQSVSTGVGVVTGDGVLFELYTDSDCSGSPSSQSGWETVPTLSTTNWWVSV